MRNTLVAEGPFLVPLTARIPALDRPDTDGLPASWRGQGRRGELPVNVSLDAIGNAVRPDFAANWQLRFQIQFLFPK